MSDTKGLNNQLDVLHGRMDMVERARFALEQERDSMRQQRDAARSEANYFRQECRALADRGNAAQAIQEALTKRVESHRRGAMPGDRIAAAALIECEAVLAVVTKLIGGAQ